MEKLNDRCFCYLTAAMLVPMSGGVSIQSFIYLGERLREWITADLNLGEVVYIWIIFLIQASWIHLMNNYDFFIFFMTWHCQPATTLACRYVILIESFAFASPSCSQQDWWDTFSSSYEDESNKRFTLPAKLWCKRSGCLLWWWWHRERFNKYRYVSAKP